MPEINEAHLKENEGISKIRLDLLFCCKGWDPEARVLGNVKASEVIRLLQYDFAEIRRLKEKIKQMSSGIIIRGKNMDEVTTNYARALVKSKLERLEQGEN